MAQPLTDIADVTVQVSPAGAAPNGLNIGLIVGPSTVIPVATRTVQYASTAAMLAAGFTTTDPEYEAALLYFGQTPAPQSVVIGVQNVAGAETITTAVTACRSSSSVWYGAYACGAADADVEGVAQFIQTAVPTSTYFYDTADSAVLAGTTPNVMSTLQADKYSLTIGIYSTTAHAGAAVLGLAMGSNTGLANSAFTLGWKSLEGVTPEVLTTTQANAILGWNGNIYTAYGTQYDLFTAGTGADGTPYDQTLNLAQLAQSIQLAVVNALTSGPKIPQTDAGVSILVDAIAGVCQQAVTQGVLAPGTWQNAPVLGLATGAAMPAGYVVQAATIASQTATQITARQSPPIYACVNLAGAIQSVTIGVIVNQ